MHVLYIGNQASDFNQKYVSVTKTKNDQVYV